MSRERDNRLLELYENSPVPEWRRPEAPPAATRPAADHPVPVSEPGRCQICGTFGPLTQTWPAGLPARYADLCDDCQALGDAEICRRLDPWWRRDGAVV
jgi:hypothetical protein